MGKSHLLFYLYHGESGYNPPEYMPAKNRFGAIVNPETDAWTLAHLDGIFSNDSKINLMWMLRTEHGKLEPNIRRIKIVKSLKDAGIK